MLLSSLAATWALAPSVATAGSVPCDCESCHGGEFHGPNWAGCSGCHDSPPQDASHLVHYNSAPLMSAGYGDTAVHSTAEAYQFGCGNCHPLDRAFHRNQTVDVELYNASAPEGSIKAKNPPTATFDANTKTCANIYCHSGNTVTSTAVGSPLLYPANPVPPGYTLNTTRGGSYIMDETCSNLTYPPYTVTYNRQYVTTPAWGTGGTFGACTECHEFPLTTYYPEVSAAVGDTHQWVGQDTYNWGHAWNMIGDPVPCRTCHNSTVTEARGADYGPYGRSGEWIMAYEPVPLSSHSAHVNGVPDVAFDTLNGYVYQGGYYGVEAIDLSTASYDPATKTCSNVGCHYKESKHRFQKEVPWGGPWREAVECDICHRYGFSPTCTTP